MRGGANSPRPSVAEAEAKATRQQMAVIVTSFIGVVWVLSMESNNELHDNEKYDPRVPIVSPAVLCCTESLDWSFS